MLRKTFKYRLYPSKSQEERLDRTLETCRRWYDACLAERKAAWEQEQRTVGKYEQLAKVKVYRKEDPNGGQLHSHILQFVWSDLPGPLVEGSLDRMFLWSFHGSRCERSLEYFEKGGTRPWERKHSHFSGWGVSQILSNSMTFVI